jgi:hypothetical protein
VPIVVYVASALFTVLWFRSFKPNPSFGGWCILPLALLLIRMSRIAFDSIGDGDDYLKMLTMIPLGFVAVYFASSQRLPPKS